MAHSFAVKFEFLLARMFNRGSMTFPQNKDVVVSGASLNHFDEISTAIQTLSDSTSTIHRAGDISPQPEKVAENFFRANMDKEYVMVVSDLAVYLFCNDLADDNTVTVSYGRFWIKSMPEIIEHIHSGTFIDLLVERK